MNKIIKTIAVLMAGMVLTAGTAVAAPHHGGHRPHCLRRLGIMSFTTLTIMAVMPDGLRLAQRLSARSSAG